MIDNYGHWTPEEDYSTYPREKWCDMDRVAAWIQQLETIDALMEVPAIEITATNTANCYYVIVRDADLRERILNSVKAHYEAKIDECIKELGTL
jgi:hypothetical protein